MKSILITFLLANISPVDGIKGTVIASPSRENPDYYYHWVRDAALVMSTVWEQKLGSPEQGGPDQLMRNFVSATKRHQELSGDAHLGEPKYHVDGKPYTEPWGRPQNDGPALRSLTLTKWAQDLLNRGEAAYVQNSLYDGKLPSTSVIKRDLEYVAHHWSEPCFDLWEEVKGEHFYTLAVSARALHEGSRLADRLNDSSAAVFYRQQVKKIKKRLGSFLSSSRGWIIPTLRATKRNFKTSDLDVSVVLGLLHSDFIFLSPTDPWVLKTLVKLEEGFKKIYEVNGHGPGVAIGRYPEDAYFGGNPWFLTTAAMGEIYFRLARASSNPELTRAYAHKGETFLERIRYHMPHDQRLTEQFRRDNGYVVGASDLTWSYASILTLLHAKEEVLAQRRQVE